MQDMQNALIRLVAYGRNTDLLPEEDEIYTVNRLLELFEIDELQGELSVHEQIEEARKETSVEDLEEILKELLDGAFKKGILKENSVVYRDLFDTRIMSMLLPRPGEVICKFRELYAKSPKEATDYYYKFSGDTDYIRRYRIKRDMKWEAPTGYGDLTITINLSKPEKDPKAIAAAKLMKQAGSIIRQDRITALFPFRSMGNSGDSSILPMFIIMSTVSCLTDSMYR